MDMKLNELPDKLNVQLNGQSELRQVIHGLWENKYIILTIILLTLIITSLYLYNKPAQYEANVLIQIDDKSTEDNLRLSQMHLSSGASAIAYQSALIQSRVILDPIIEQLGLATYFEASHSSLGHFFSRPISHVDFIKRFSVPNSYLNTHLKLKMISATQYALYDSQDQFILKGTLGKLTQSRGFTLWLTKKPNVEDSEFYIIKYSNTNLIKNLLTKIRVEELSDANSGQTGILQVNLRDTDATRVAGILNAIAEAIKVKSIQRKTEETAKTLSFLRGQLPVAKASLEKAEAALNHYRATSGKIDIKIQTEQMMEQLAAVEKSIIETDLQRTHFLGIYTESYPVIIELTQKIWELNKLKEKLSNQIKTLPESDQVAMNLMRDVKVKNDLYLVLLNKIQEMQVIHSGKLSDVSILAAAVPPDAPLPDRLSIIYPASLLLGVMLGCMIVLLKNSFSRRVIDPHWIERHLGLANLAMVPFSSQQMKNKTEYKSRLTRHLPILAESNPGDLSIEALRSLRTSFELLLGSPNKKIISFTGISPGVGKSFVSINFSYLLSSVDKKVLLIDGDIRRGDLHSSFMVNQSPGLNELISNQASLTDAIKKTNYDNLSFISCGLYPKKPAELLMKKRFKEMLTSLKDQFDYIILDTPPVLAVTDSAIIASLADINFLIIGSNMHQPEEIILTVKKLENAGVSLQGTIFNNINNKSTFYGNYKYHYDYYARNDLETSASLSS